MTFNNRPYPSFQPVEDVQLRATLSGVAGVYFGLVGRTEQLVRFLVRSPSGSIISVSREYAYPSVLENLANLDDLSVPSARSGYTLLVEFVTLDRLNGRFPGYTKVPFKFVIMRTKAGRRVITVKPVVTSSSGLRQSIHVARLRSTRNAVRQKRVRQAFPPRQPVGPINVTSVRQKKHSNNDGSHITASLVTVPVRSRTSIGVVTPGFRYLKRKGQLPINPYFVEEIDTADGGYYSDYTSVLNPSFNQYDVGPYTGFFGQGTGNPPSGLALRASLDNRVISKLITATGQNTNNVAADIAQYQQTVNMISSTLTRLTGAVKAVKGGNIPKAAAILFQTKPPRYKRGKYPTSTPGTNYKQSAADNWLALQYGWKPLLQDIQGSMASLANFLTPLRSVQVASASATEREVTVEKLVINTALGAQTGNIVTYTEWTNRIGIRYTTDSPKQAFLTQLGMTNPISLAWELLPWSFVVDWAIPIGPYLESLTAWRGLAFNGGWSSKRARKITYYEMSYCGPLYPGDSDAVVTYLGNYRQEHFIYTRSALGSFPTMEFPSFKNPVSVTHGLNALALLNTAFRGK